MGWRHREERTHPLGSSCTVQATSRRWLSSTGVWLVWIEMCAKDKTHTRFWRLDVKNVQFSIILKILITWWNNFTSLYWVELNILLRLISPVSLFNLCVTQFKITYMAHILSPLDSTGLEGKIIRQSFGDRRNRAERSTWEAGLRKEERWCRFGVFPDWGSFWASWGHKELQKLPVSLHGAPGMSLWHPQSPGT